MWCPIGLHTTLSIAAGRGFIAGQAPELKPIEKLKYKITTKTPIDIRSSRQGHFSPSLSQNRA